MVRRGLSVRTVSAPTRIAPQSARRCMASRRAAGEVIHRRFVGEAMRPSRLMPALAVT